MKNLIFLAFLVIIANMIEVSIARHEKDLILIGGNHKCGPKLLLKSGGHRSGGDLLIVNDCDDKKHEHVKYVGVPVPVHTPVHMHDQDDYQHNDHQMHDMWRK